MRTRIGGRAAVVILCVAVILSMAAHADETKAPGIGCSIFAVQVGDTVLFGNNVDDGNPNTYYSVFPSHADGEYGYITLGFHQAQGGLNEAGLAFDTNAVRARELVSRTDLHLPQHPGGPIGIVLEMLRNAATVDEALAIAERYHWADQLSNQWLIADAQGQAVVISAGRNGELAMTRKPTGDGYLTSTNINRSRSLPVFACWRFRTITRMLRGMVARGSITVEDVAAVLDAAHQEGVFLREGVLLNTVYSNIYDLKTREITVYYWYQFDSPITLRLDEELAGGSRRVRVRDLFPSQVVQRAASENERLLALAEPSHAGIWPSVGVALASAVLLGLILFRG